MPQQLTDFVQDFTQFQPTGTACRSNSIRAGLAPRSARVSSSPGSKSLKSKAPVQREVRRPPEAEGHGDLAIASGWLLRL